MGLFFFLGDFMFFQYCSTEGNILINTDEISHVIDIKMHEKDSGTRAIYLKNGKMFEVSNSLDEIQEYLNAIKTNNNSR
jgi:cell wall-associated NlpC family hydrolase